MNLRSLPVDGVETNGLGADQDFVLVLELWDWVVVCQLVGLPCSMQQQDRLGFWWRGEGFIWPDWGFLCLCEVETVKLGA